MFFDEVIEQNVSRGYGGNYFIGRPSVNLSPKHARTP